jgi:NADH:ubiquinone oxidoreductase subunit E
MDAKKTLFLCMGSACHQSGGHTLVPKLQALIDRHGLAESVELKGAFCLDRCGTGGSLEFEGRVVTGLVSSDLEEVFRAEVLARLASD